MECGVLLSLGHVERSVRVFFDGNEGFELAQAVVESDLQLDLFRLILQLEVLLDQLLEAHCYYVLL